METSSSRGYLLFYQKPKRSEILFHDLSKGMQMWKRLPMPEELQRIRSMDEWFEKPSSFEEFVLTSVGLRRRRRCMVLQWKPTYITGGIIYVSSGLKLISDTHHTLLSKETSSPHGCVRSWSSLPVSYILSVVVLATLIYAMYFIDEVKLKRSCWAFSRRLKTTQENTSWESSCDIP